MIWTEKYRPRTLDEVVGNEDAKAELLKWVLEWEKGTAKESGALLIGPPGVGKTTAVHALAQMLNYHVVEINASDVRTAKRIEERVGHVIRASTLDSFSKRESKVRKKVMLFFDEIDGIDPHSDKGGLSKVLEIMNKREVLTIAAANVVDPVVHKELLENVKVIEFRKLTPRQILVILKRIVVQENLKIPDKTLVRIARECRGDARIAINFLQSSSVGVELEAISPALENLPYDALMRRLSSSHSLSEIANLISSNSNQLEDVFYGYYDIVVKSLIMKPEDKVKYLVELSNIDMIFGRMNKRRHFSSFRYLLQLIPQLIYSINRSGALYDGRLPEYKFHLFVVNKAIREEIKNFYEGIVKGQLHLSYRKFVLYVLPFLYYYIDKSKYPNIAKFCEAHFKVTEK